MKALAKQYGPDLVALAYHIADADLAVLANLIDKEGLTLVEATVEQRAHLWHLPTKVVARTEDGPMAATLGARTENFDVTLDQQALAFQIAALRVLSFKVSLKRSGKNLLNQAEIYQKKKEQAALVLAGHLEDVPYVDLDAEVNSVSLEEAATRIQTASGFHAALLFGTESVRAEYTVRASLVQTQRDLDDFKRDLDAALL